MAQHYGFSLAVTARAGAGRKLKSFEPGTYEAHTLVAPAQCAGARSFSRLLVRRAGRRPRADAAALGRADFRPFGRCALGDEVSATVSRSEHRGRQPSHLPIPPRLGAHSRPDGLC